MLPALRCGQNAFAENIFFSYSAVQTIFESIRQLCRKMFKVITRIFIVELLPFLPYLKMRAMPIIPMCSKKKNNQCLAESAVSVSCLQIARVWILNYGWGVNLHRPQISSDPEIHCFGHRYTGEC